MRKISSFLISILLIFSYSSVVHGTSKEPKKVAIIIDDFGGGVGGVKEFLEGDIPITATIMPFTEKTREHAIWAHKNGFEVMVHLPMQPKRGKLSWLGPKPITADLSPKEVRQRVLEAIDSVPFAIGLNNHMGSLIVENEQIVREIVKVAKEKKMYIVDSRTSPKSKFSEITAELGVPLLKRDVFLDDVSSVAHVRKQMLMLAEITEKAGKGIAIGHVGITGKACSLGIFQSEAEFDNRNIQIVPASELLSDQIQSKLFKMNDK